MLILIFSRNKHISVLLNCGLVPVVKTVSWQLYLSVVLNFAIGTITFVSIGGNVANWQ